MKKILYCISDDQFGGGSFHLLKLLENINRKKYLPILISKNSDIARRLTKKTKCYILPLKNRIDATSINKLKGIITEEKPNIIHLHSTRSGILGTMAAKQTEIPIIYTEHLFTKSYIPKNKIIYWVQKTAFKKLAGYIKQVIAVSNSVKNYLVDEKIFPENKISVIYNGVEIPDNFINKSKNNYTVGSIGSLQPIKGYNYLIEAIDIIRRKNPKIYKKIILKIIGSGPEKENLQKQIRSLKLQNKISFLNYPEDIDEEINQWNLYIQPSLSESFGMAIAEAMAHGLPIIASKVGGIVEIVNDYSGILIEPKRSDLLAKSIIKLFSDVKLSRKMGKCARQRIKDKFSLKKMIANTEKIYEKIN